MATARVEFVNLGARATPRGRFPYGSERPDAPNIISEIAGTAHNLAVGATATAGVNRPAAPAGFAFALVTAVAGNVVAAWGGDPTATQTNGRVVLEGVTEAIAVAEGEMLSLIELA